MKNYETYKVALEHVEKPCAFVDVDSLTTNMKAIAIGAKDKKIRIASKSIRSLQVLKDILAFSPIFQGVMCFTAEEALYLHEQGFDDLLIAYPTWDETQLKRISEHVKKGATITVMIDNLEHIKRLESIAEATKGKFLVAIDIDLSTSFPGLYFGVFRSPLHEVTDVVELIERVNNSQLLTLDGLMGYEAQIAGVPDDAPNQFLKNIVIRTLKKLSNRKIVQKRSEIMKAL